MMKQNTEENKNVSYGLDIDLWTTAGEHLVARYEMIDFAMIMLSPNEAELMQSHILVSHL